MKSKIVKLTIAAVGLLLTLWLLAEEESVAHEQLNQPVALQVSVIETMPATLQPKIQVSGTVKPRWQLDLVANVAGQLVQEFDHLLPGMFVKKGQVMARIDDTDYRAQLATAQSRIAQAKLNLARYLNEQQVATQLDKGQISNDFRLQKPHVEAAKAELEAAQANYQSALRHLNDTQIKAPFDAIVLAKFIAPAGQINQGQILYSVASSQAQNIEVSLSENQWQRIAANSEIAAQIYDDNGTKLSAKLRYQSPQLNTHTRQRSLVLSIAQPYQNSNTLALEQQVTVEFSGRTIDNAVTAPATALTRDNKVWTLQSNVLKLETVNLLEDHAKQITFTFEQ